MKKISIIENLFEKHYFQDFEKKILVKCFEIKDYKAMQKSGFSSCTSTLIHWEIVKKKNSKEKLDVVNKINQEKGRSKYIAIELQKKQFVVKNKKKKYKKKKLKKIKKKKYSKKKFKK